MHGAELDPYWKLRPVPATPEEDVCHCPPGSAVVLVYRYDSNPLMCIACGGEVLPERLGFGEELADQIASWRAVNGSLFDLWLDSGEYENWAAERLLDPGGQVNRMGREVVAQLTHYGPAFYLWFQDVGSDGYEPPERCPLCHQRLEGFEERNYRACQHCRILI